MVLVSASADDGVEGVDVQSRHDALEQFLRHLLVVNHANRLTALTAFHALSHLLHNTAVQVVLDVHLGVLSELERVCLVGSLSRSDEYHRQAVAYDIVEIHDVLLVVALGQSYEASQFLVGHGYQGIIDLWFLLVLNPHHALYCKEDAVVARGAYLLHLREPYRVGAAVELLQVQAADE